METFLIPWMDGVDAANIWLALSGLPFAFVVQIVLRNLWVQQCPRHWVKSVELKESSERSLRCLNQSVGQVLIRRKVDPLSVRQVNSEMLNGWKVVVNGVCEDPPGCLVGRDVATKLEFLDFVVPVWIVNGEDTGVAALVDVFA